MARIFAAEGADARNLFSAMIDNAKPNSTILLVVDPVTRFEVSYSIKNYLSFYGYNGLYAYGIDHPATSDFEKGLNNQWSEWFKGRELKDLGQAPDEIIIFDKNQSDAFFAESGLRSSDYKNTLADSHEVYITN
jgi:hypothetical protein